MSGFTKGPWVVEEDDSLFGCTFVPVCTESGITLAEVSGDSCEPGQLTGVDRANARLIAAAPCMFETLSLLRDALAEMDAELHAQNIGVIDLTLARARGEQP